MADEAKRIAPELKVNWFPNNYPREFMNSKDTLWLKVTPKTFRPDINVQARGNQGTTSNVSLYFLMAKSFSFGVDHTWNDLTTVAGGFREVKAGIEKAAAQATAVGGVKGGTALGLNLRNTYAAGQVIKNDNPFIYESSSRRKLQIEFKFAAHNDAEQEVWNPIQSLMVWSSADKSSYSKNTVVDMPYIFKVQTVTGEGTPVNLVSIDNAAIESVLPTYSEPYHKGYPMSATAQVNFVDINPTYRSLMTSTGKARISAKLDTDDLEELG